MTRQSTDQLILLCNVIPPLIGAITDEEFSSKSAPDKWSKKEIIGHLTDSAANNHHRFIRCQFEESPTIWYDQDKWNQHGYYQQMDKKQLIQFWRLYNLHLAELIRFIPTENLQRTCTMKDGSKLTLDFLINDYVQHLEHHLKQIVNYD